MVNPFAIRRFLPHRSSLGANAWRVSIAGCLSAVGDGVRLVALPLSAVATTADPVQITAVVAATRLPWILAPVIGAAVDRLSRHRVMVVADLTRAAVMLLLAGVTLLRWREIAILLVVALTAGVAEVFFETAGHALAPSLVTDRDFERVNARLVTVQAVGLTLVGPPLGLLLWTMWTPAAFLLDAASFLASAAIISRVTVGTAAGPVSAGLLRSTLAGLRYLVRHRTLRVLIVLMSATCFANQGAFSLLVLYTSAVLGLPGHSYGWLLIAGGVGSLVAANTAPALLRLLGHRVALISSIAALSATCLGLAFVTWWPLAAGLITLNSAATAVLNVIILSARQRLSPPQLLGRVTAGARSVARGATALGATMAGLAAGAVGIPLTWILASVVLAASVSLAVLLSTSLTFSHGSR
ncbi:MFS transporter [Nonomuraea zeae]|uniref:MFS transporter n=1 Tax=Nonomuraea zeae TaxID=1642303 RepID=A0A5S4GME9_9ACTN|nr:MFS transporter [Nonomuraea zeae]TMR34053.1 MFS transporter [Nonomuraea zeae]